MAVMEKMSNARLVIRVIPEVSYCFRAIRMKERIMPRRAIFSRGWAVFSFRSWVMLLVFSFRVLRFEITKIYKSLIDWF